MFLHVDMDLGKRQGYLGSCCMLKSIWTDGFADLRNGYIQTVSQICVTAGDIESNLYNYTGKNKGCPPFWAYP